MIMTYFRNPTNKFLYILQSVGFEDLFAKADLSGVATCKTLYIKTKLLTLIGFEKLFAKTDAPGSDSKSGNRSIKGSLRAYNLELGDVFGHHQGNLPIEGGCNLMGSSREENA